MECDTEVLLTTKVRRSKRLCSQQLWQNCILSSESSSLKIVLVGPKENEARKAFRKAMRAFGRVDFAPAHHKRDQAVIITHTKVRARIKEEQSRKVSIHIQDFQPLKIRLKRNKFRGTTTWFNSRHFAWFASVPLYLAHHPTHVVLNLGCTRSVGSRTAIRRFQKYALHHVFVNSETETCQESCIIHVRQHHHVLPELMCLRRVMCPSSSPFLR